MATAGLDAKISGNPSINYNRNAVCYAYSALMGNAKYAATNWTSRDKMLSVDALYQPNSLVLGGNC